MEDARNEIEKRVEEKVTEAVTTGVSILVAAAVTFVVTVVVLKFVWAWVVPDLFPGAVDQGLINAELTWLATVKFAAFVSVVNGVYHSLIGVFERK